VASLLLIYLLLYYVAVSSTYLGKDDLKYIALSLSKQPKDLTKYICVHFLSIKICQMMNEEGAFIGHIYHTHFITLQIQLK